MKDVILQLEGLKYEDIVDIKYNDDTIIVTTKTSMVKFKISKKLGSYLVCGDEQNIIDYECSKI